LRRRRFARFARRAALICAHSDPPEKCLAVKMKPGGALWHRPAQNKATSSRVPCNT
jgi:hypothetical protein